MERFALISNSILMEENHKLELIGFGMLVFAKYFGKDLKDFYSKEDDENYIV